MAAVIQVLLLILPGSIVPLCVDSAGWQGGAARRKNSMADAPYLVALALVEFAGKRALPLTGKSQAAAAADAVDPGDDGRTLALELLLRLWQRSEEGPLQRAAGEASLLLVELPIELMSVVARQPQGAGDQGLADHDRQVRAGELHRLALIGLETQPLRQAFSSHGS
jgi:hypothetical protein